MKPSSNVLTSEPLYEISAELVAAGRALSDFYDLPEAEQTPEAEAAMVATWKGLMVSMDQKAQGCALVIREADLRADDIKAEVARLRAMGSRLERKTAWLKAYVLSNMAAAGVKKIEGRAATVTRAASPPAVVIDEGAPADVREYLPAELIREVPATYTPDKDAILRWWKAKAPLPPHVSIREGEHLRIK